MAHFGVDQVKELCPLPILIRSHARASENREITTSPSTRSWYQVVRAVLIQKADDASHLRDEAFAHGWIKRWRFAELLHVGAGRFEDWHAEVMIGHDKGHYDIVFVFRSFAERRARRECSGFEFSAP